MGKRGYKPTPPEVRFWKFVQKTETCWLWTGCTNTNGYGTIGVPPRGKKKLAHRLSYEIHCGEIPEGKVVRHKCDNPPCVNPAHLEFGTQQDNQRDAVIRDRRHNDGKLNMEIAQEIRVLYERGIFQKELAQMYGVSRPQISHIVNHKSWKC